MSESSESMARLARLCVVREELGPWASLVEAADEIIRSHFISGGGAHGDLPEFCDWFPGWLFKERKLKPLVRALDQKTTAGECVTVESQDAFVRSYFARIVSTGKTEFYRERRGREEAAGEESLSSAPARPENRLNIESALDEVGRALAALPFAIRVPFRLRYFRHLGPLTADEVEWISDQTGMECDDIVRSVADEFARHGDRQFPLSSEFIGELLGIPPSPTGRNTTVDQRVSRALRRLSEVFRPK